MVQELRNSKTYNRRMTTETSTWYAYIPVLSLNWSSIYSYWRGLTALFILCRLGNAKAFGSRIGRRSKHLHLFVYLRKLIAKILFADFGVFIGSEDKKQHAKASIIIFILLLRNIFLCGRNQKNHSRWNYNFVSFYYRNIVWCRNLVLG